MGRPKNTTTLEKYCKTKNPKERDNTRAVAPESIFPEEVWSMILNHLEGPEDLLNLNRTCRLFNTLLEKTKRQWLFPAVLPFLLPYLDLEDVLNCRMVCTSWSSSIQSFLENLAHSPLSSGGIRKLKVQVGLFIRPNPNFSTFKFHAKFTQDFPSNSRRNPLLSRSVYLRISPFDQSILDWLDKFGVHIWHLQIVLDLSNSLQCCQYIWKLLWRVPNLKILNLRVWPQNWSLSDPIVLTQRGRLHGIQPTASFLKKSAVPSLPNLRRLHATTYFPDIQQELESAYCSQLTTIHHRGLEGLELKELENVQQLSIDFNLFFHPKAITSLGSLKCPRLETLHLSCCPDQSQNQVPWGGLWKAMNTFSGSLRNLSICWKDIRFDMYPHERINLPNLHEIELRFVRIQQPYLSSFTLSFLTDLKNLFKVQLHFDERLYQTLVDAIKMRHAENRDQNLEQCVGAANAHETMPSCSEESEEKLVDLHKHFDEQLLNCRKVEDLSILKSATQVFKSNIWNLIASLQIISIKIYRVNAAVGRQAMASVGRLYTRSEQRKIGNKLAESIS